MNSRPNKIDRREFLRDLPRAALFGALGALGLALGIRSRKASPRSHTCTGNGICSGCQRLDNCILPRAASTRMAQGKEDTHA